MEESQPLTDSSPDPPTSAWPFTMCFGGTRNSNGQPDAKSEASAILDRITGWDLVRGRRWNLGQVQNWAVLQLNISSANYREARPAQVNRCCAPCWLFKERRGLWEGIGLGARFKAGKISGDGSRMGKREKAGRSKKDKGVVKETLVSDETQVIEETRVETTKDGTNPAGTVAGQDSPVHQDPENSDASDGKENPDAIPSSQEQWDMMKAMMAQMATLAKSLVSDPVPQAIENPRDGDSGVVEVIPPSHSSRKKGDYLNLLEHVSKLGTRHFYGSSDSIVVDEWRSRLNRNFNSSRCPEDYRKYTAIHFLEGEAHNWWLTVEKRKGDQIQTSSDFEEEFNKKFFPPEAWTDLSVPTWTWYKVTKRCMNMTKN
ncbi:hypothetical protein AXX17_ATUG04660 [Arabidopsis thaliana]|uniref:Retrotransposon gag domain-containing protein n=1 Tax=Arabidopsis thaliana TaxID=3702 RepID=A0A178U5B4_ARATH|nr:hypothetical protein AXX17_ATUG04660 [Arabidopsis thaliana]